MITIDANLIIYAHHSTAPQHVPARKWFEQVLSGFEPVRLAWSTIHAFLRIATHPSIFPKAFSIGDARSLVEDWLAQPSVALLEPGEMYWEIFGRLLTSGQVRGNLVMDAHLAALAIEHGATLCTTDRDFSRFEGLRLSNPLLG